VARKVDYLPMTSRRLRWPEDKRTADVVPPAALKQGVRYVLEVDVALNIGTIKEA
jgi:hypothetical protein